MDYLATARRAKADYQRRAGLAEQPVEQVIDEGKIIAVLICSHVLEDEIWFALDASYKPDPDDNRAVYHADELEFLKQKTPETLKAIHRTKLAFGGGRVRQ